MPQPTMQAGADRDAWMVRATEQLKGFGGAYLDSDGTLHVWDTVPSTFDRQRTLAALTDLYGLGAQTTEVQVVVHKADYTFAQLKSWHDKLVRLSHHDGLVATSVDEKQNRIKVALEDPSSQADAFLRDAVALGIRMAAIVVVQSDPLVLELQQRRRPLLGGLQFGFDLAAQRACSIGFVAQLSGTTGYVSNSHCSATPYSGELGDAYYQPLGSLQNPAQDLVAHKAVDPPAFSCTGYDGCRFSDAMFADIESGVASTRGYIARAPIGSPNWNGTNRFRITDTLPGGPTPGEVRKVGRTTGQTIGQVVDTCVNITAPVGALTYLLVCQDLGDYVSAGGDSGAPVFRLTNDPDPGDVTLYGVHVGRLGETGPTVFSAWANIEFELGTLTACAPTAPGLGC